MSVQQQTPVNRYMGNGVATVYATNFKALSKADVAAWIDGVAKTVDVDFSVSGLGVDPGFSVTWLTGAPANGAVVVIARQSSIDRLTDYQNLGDFNTSTVNPDFDNPILILQELKEQASRSLRFPISDSSTNIVGAELSSVTNRKGKFLFFNAITGAIEYALVTTTAISQSIIGQLLNPQTTAETAAGIIPINFWYKAGNIRRYGAAVDGATDDAAAFRKALDLSARDGTTLTCDPPGVIKLNSTIYLPQRLTAASQYGYEVDLYGSTLVGQGNGTGTMFETGTGTLSTGGSSNFSSGNETAGSIHWGTIIKGAKLRNYGIAFNLHNFIQGCALRDLWGESGHTLVQARRSFYLNLINCVGKATSGMTATEAVFLFNAENNAIKLLSCSAIATGAIGFRFDGGIKGLLIDTCSAEQSGTGIKINDSVLGAEIRGCYIEGNTVGLDLGTNPKYGLNVDGNYWFANTTDVTGNNWQSGAFGNANTFEDAPLVDLSGTGNYCRVYLQSKQWPNTGGGDHTSWTNVPTGFNLNQAIEVVHQDSIYNTGIGFNSQFARLASISGGGGIVGLNYAGAGGVQATGVIPFCTTTIVALNSLQIDTKISYTQAAAAEFDIQVIDSVSTYLISARIAYGAVIPRFDVTAKTVTPSNNAGNLRITLGGFVTISSYNGSVRIV